VALAAADTITTQARPPRLVALHAEVLAALAAADTIAPQARRPLLVKAPPAGAMHATAATMMNVAATSLGRKRISPLTKLSASAK
jgi:hypothetical protein